MTPHARRAAAIAAISTLLAGCAANAGSPDSALNAKAQPARGDGRSTLVARNAIPAPHPDRSASWLLAQAASSDLLYISDVGTNDVYVYTYPAGNLVGTLTGFTEPQGECSDGKGNVWIANTQKSRIVEYAHGGTTPIATLLDPGEYPGGCAVDAQGNLAVANLVATTGGRGSVAWYAGAKGKPQIIASSSFEEVYFAGFDRAGNLFVDGWPPNFAQAVLGEIAHGSDRLVSVPINGATIEYPGGVQVHGNTVDVGDQIDNAVFHIDEDGTVAGVMPLDGASDCVEGTILRKTFVCPDSGNAAVEFFRYPAGGAPKRATKGLSEPTGSAFSPSS